MLEIRLSDADRERLGIRDEWLQYDVGRLMAREAAILYRATKYDPYRLAQSLRSRPVVDDDGQPVTQPDVDDEGNPVLDAEGKPVLVPVTTLDPSAWLALVWLCVIRTGVAVSYKDFDFDFADFSFRVVDEDDDEDQAVEPGAEDGSGNPSGHDTPEVVAP